MRTKGKHKLVEHTGEKSKNTKRVLALQAGPNVSPESTLKNRLRVVEENDRCEVSPDSKVILEDGVSSPANESLLSHPAPSRETPSLKRRRMMADLHQHFPRVYAATNMLKY
jgi:hypothetical protein